MAARRASGTKLLDVLMVSLPGRERTEAEWFVHCVPDTEAAGAGPLDTEGVRPADARATGVRVDDTMRRCILRLYRPAEVVAALTAHREGPGR